jgi:hypothetical protein
MNCDWRAFAFQIKRGGQPRYAGADDCDKFHSVSEKLNLAAALSGTLVFPRLRTNVKLHLKRRSL